MNFGRGFGRDLQRITEEFERRARTEPDIDFEIRDEFIDYDESDEEQVEKIDKKFEQYLEKKKRHEERKGRLKLSNEWGGIDHPDLEETVEQSIIERQMDQYNETINSSCLSNGTINKNFSDGHVTKQFIRGLVNKENVRPTQLSSETFIVEEAPKFDETVIKDNPMYGIQNTMYAHAVNKLAARMRRQNPHLHQGSFSLDKSTLSEFELTPSELPGETTVVSESFLYSEDEDDTILEREEPVTAESTDTDGEETNSYLHGRSTYINIDNHTVDSRYAAGEPSLPVIEYVNGRQVQVGTKSRKPKLPNSTDSDPEISIAFADLRIDNKKSKKSKRLSSTRLDYTKIQDTPTSRRVDQQLIRPTFSAPQPSRARRFRDATTPTRLRPDQVLASLDELMNSPSARRHREMRQLLEQGYKKV